MIEFEKRRTETVNDGEKEKMSRPTLYTYLDTHLLFVAEGFFLGATSTIFVLTERREEKEKLA